MSEKAVSNLDQPNWEKNATSSLRVALSQSIMALESGTLENLQLVDQRPTVDTSSISELVNLPKLYCY